MKLLKLIPACLFLTISFSAVAKVSDVPLAGVTVYRATNGADASYGQLKYDAIGISGF